VVKNWEKMGKIGKIWKKIRVFCKKWKIRKMAFFRVLGIRTSIPDPGYFWKAPKAKKRGSKKGGSGGGSKMCIFCQILHFRGFGKMAVFSGFWSFRSLRLKKRGKNRGSKRGGGGNLRGVQNRDLFQACFPTLKTPKFTFF
jgi:hypothetical protein